MPHRKEVRAITIGRVGWLRISVGSARISVGSTGDDLRQEMTDSVNNSATGLTLTP
jgi:hypothetical protein